MGQSDPAKPTQSTFSKFISSISPVQAVQSYVHSLNKLIFSDDSQLSKIRKDFNKFYNEFPPNVADFKANYVYKIGDQRIRMIITSVISIPLWLVTNRNNSYLYRVRNLAFVFAGVGVFVCPQLFNPFLPDLPKKKKASS